MSEKLVDWMNPAEREAAIAAKWAEKADEVKRLTAEVTDLKEQLTAREARIKQLKKFVTPEQVKFSGLDLQDNLEALREHDARLLEEMVNVLGCEHQDLPKSLQTVLNPPITEYENRTVIRCQNVLLREATARRTK